MDLIPYFFLNSLVNEDDMILCLMCEGAEKCALLDFLLELVTSGIFNKYDTCVSLHFIW
jgi:hypothetical protein